MNRIFKQESFIVSLLILSVLCICFYDVVFLKKTFKVTTAAAQAYPYGVYQQQDNKPPFFHTFGVDSAVLEEPIYEFIRQNLQKGIFPLWNPHQGCGYPLITMTQFGFFFPLTFIMYLLPRFIAWDIMILARFFLAGLFTFWLMRGFKINRLSSFVAAVIFMLSGPLVLIQNVTANVDILTPLLLLSLERLIQHANRKNLCFVSTVCALTFFAGHPEHIFFVNLFGFIFFCVRVFTLRRNIPILKTFRYLLGAYGLSFGLSALTMFPFYQNFATEFWHGHPHGTGLLVEEHKERLLAVAIPYFFESAPMNQQWTPGGWWGGYIGVIPLGLAFLSLFRRQKGGLNYFFFIFGTLIVGKTFGWTVINWIGHLPLFKMCRFAFHTPVYVALCTAIAAGMGVRMIFANRKISLYAAIYSAFLTALVVLNLLLYKSMLDAKITGNAIAIAVGVLLLYHLVLLLNERKIIKRHFTALLILMVIIAELFLYIPRARAKRFDSFHPTPYTEFLQKRPRRERAYGGLWAFFPDTATGYGIDDLGIFESLILQRFVTFINTFIKPGNFMPDLRPTTFRTSPLENCKPYADLLNVRYAVFPGEGNPPSEYIERENLKMAFATRDIKIWERQDAFPRVFIVHRAIFQEKEEDAIKTLKSIWTDLDKTVVIGREAELTIINQLNQVPEKDLSHATITKYTPNEVEISATMENAGFLVLSDTYHFDWQAFVDGKKTEVFPANYLIRSVFLPRGRHEVRFVFKPASFYWGIWVSLFSLLILLFILFYPKFKQQYSQAY